MEKYPVIHIIVLMIGSIILLLLKKRYKGIRHREMIIIFVLMILLIALFTDTGIDLAKQFINLIQVD